MNNEFKTCPQCGHHIDSKLQACPHCHQDQSVPVTKQLTSTSELAQGVFLYCIAGLKRECKDVLHHERRSIWTKASVKQAVLRECTLARFAVGYVVYNYHFQQHNKRDKLDHHFVSLMNSYLGKTFGVPNVKAMHNNFLSKVQEYGRALNSDNAGSDLATIYQAQMETASYGAPYISPDAFSDLAKQLGRPIDNALQMSRFFLTPSVHDKMFYAIRISGFVEQLGLFLNRWDVS